MITLLVVGIALAIVSMALAIALRSRAQPWSTGSRLGITITAVLAVACIAVGAFGLLAS